MIHKSTRLRLSFVASLYFTLTAGSDLAEAFADQVLLAHVFIDGGDWYSFASSSRCSFRLRWGRRTGSTVLVAITPTHLNNFALRGTTNRVNQDAGSLCAAA